MDNSKEPKLKCPFCGHEKDALIGCVIDTKDVSICNDCLERKIEEAEQIVKERDERKLRDRAGRKVQLGILTYSSEGKGPPFYLWDLTLEAFGNYQEECFRSCIFCCAEIVEQVIKHELIRNSEDPEEKQWQLEIKRATFGDLIKEAKKLGELKKYIADAQWLNDARNTIAAHPLYVGVYEKGDDLQTKIWKNRTMIRNIRKTLEFLDKRDRETILKSELSYESGGEFIKLGDMLKDPTLDHVFVMWSLLSKDILEKLALKAYTRMKKIVEGVYPAD